MHGQCVCLLYKSSQVQVSAVLDFVRPSHSDKRPGWACGWQSRQRLHASFKNSVGIASPTGKTACTSSRQP